jgi:hypothetical protein
MKKILLAACVLFFFEGCKKDKQDESSLPGSYSNRSVGASANDLLSAVNYTTLKIEIQYMPGYAPDAAAISHFQNLLYSILNKPTGIQVAQRQISSGNKSVYSLDDIRLIESANRTAYTQSGTVAIYILITDGDYADNGVLGIAYRNTSAVLLGKTIHANSGGLGQASRTKVEATVMEHEFGHLAGLVNIGSPMQTNHQDAAHGNHCSNTDCLMYYASETTDILGFLITGSIPTFDSNCRNDLRGNGGN